MFLQLAIHEYSRDLRIMVDGHADQIWVFQGNLSRQLFGLERLGMLPEWSDKLTIMLMLTIRTLLYCPFCLCVPTRLYTVLSVNEYTPFEK